MTRLEAIINTRLLKEELKKNNELIEQYSKSSNSRNEYWLIIIELQNEVEALKKGIKLLEAAAD